MPAVSPGVQAQSVKWFPALTLDSRGQPHLLSSLSTSDRACMAVAT